MKIQKHSIRKIVTFLNNPDEDGGFWLPNIQRDFVWHEEQICRLFDSILREYPISTLLIWKTRGSVKCRKFIDQYRKGIPLVDLFAPNNEKKKCLVLDGQQRLQSLFIGLAGTYEQKELYFNVLSGDVAAPEDIKYKFDFLEARAAKFPWIRFKDLVFCTKTCLALANQVIQEAGRTLNEAEQDKISNHIALVFKTFHGDDGIAYQELDSIENEKLYSEEDVVEVFIRANSGGTQLGKSDLLFSLLSSSWENSGIEMQNLLENLNRRGFKFSRDFILKACLALIDQGAEYKVEKFRRPGVKEKIEENWEAISESICDVVDFIRNKTFVRCDRAIPSYLTLIPIIYLRHHFEDSWRKAEGIDRFLIRSWLAGAFTGAVDRIIDSCVVRIRESRQFDAAQLYDVIRTKGKSLEITEERFWGMGYGSDTIHLLFNLWYPQFDYVPTYEGNYPQIDHIFPQSALRKIKTNNPETGHKNVMKYKDADRNQLANCMLLTQEENSIGQKGDQPPEEWFSGKNKNYLKMHLIPENTSLWKIERFDEFIAARKLLIREKFRDLLVHIETASTENRKTA